METWNLHKNIQILIIKILIWNLKLFQLFAYMNSKINFADYIYTHFDKNQLSKILHDIYIFANRHVWCERPCALLASSLNNKFTIIIIIIIDTQLSLSHITREWKPENNGFRARRGREGARKRKKRIHSIANDNETLARRACVRQAGAAIGSGSFDCQAVFSETGF